jgi:23S rRNA (guanosine2251-2'-O)-methyltransferase
MKTKPDNSLTIFGRNPVQEALESNKIKVLRVHLADSNKPGDAIKKIERLAQQQRVDVRYHSKLELSRISRNGKQDQGVAADIHCPTLQPWNNLISFKPTGRLLAVDRINNPQNLGMIIRSACAGGMNGLLLPSEAGNTRLSPLVIKASTGTLFKFPIYQCDKLSQTLIELQSHGYKVCSLQGDGEQSLLDSRDKEPAIYVLGNESEGVSTAVEKIADYRLCIPMHNGVESVNVAVAAALIAFMR